MQRCPRAFVLRYGIAAYAADHPTGQMLKDAFEIQTPWISEPIERKLYS